MPAVIGSNGDEFRSAGPGVGVKFADADSVTFGYHVLSPALMSPNATGESATESGALSTGYGTSFKFIKAPIAVQTMGFTFILPQDYVPGTAVKLRIYWSDRAAAPDAGNVLWATRMTVAHGFSPQGSSDMSETLEYNIATVNLGGDYNPGGVQVPNAQFKLCATDFEATFTDETVMAPGAIVVGYLQRTYDSVLDTSTDDVEMYSVALLYQSTNFPTKNITPNFYT